jgi:hypothetical protein
MDLNGVHIKEETTRHKIFKIKFKLHLIKFYKDELEIRN